MTQKVIMVALDHGLFQRLAAAGKLPNLAAFMDESHRLTVHSEGLTLHGTLWPTFGAGRGPGHHGRYFWNQWMSEEMRHVRNDHPSLNFDPFWKALQPAGLTATIVDVPYNPGVEAPGFRICTGWGLHDEVQPFSYPEGFAKELNHIGGQSPLKFDTVEPHDSAAKRKMVRELVQSATSRMTILQSLATDQTADLTLLVVSETHKASHYLAATETIAPGMDNEDALAAILKPVDDAWPALLQAAGPDAEVILFALHGTQEQVDYGHFITQLLSLLAGAPAEDTTTRRDLVRRIRDLLPESVHLAIWRLLPARMRSARVGNLVLASTDLTKDKLFRILHDGHGAVRINQTGREQPGLVTEEEGAALIAELEELAMPFLADDGQPAFARMMHPQTEFPGPRAHHLPDGMLVTNPKVKGTQSIRAGDTVLHSEAEEARNGIHTGEGFCYLRRRPGVSPTRDDMEVCDFAPTVLQVLGAPPTTELDGTSILP